MSSPDSPRDRSSSDAVSGELLLSSVDSGEVESDELDSFLREAARVAEVAPPSDEPDRVGQVLGQFKIEKEIGRGGMGIVYAADHERLGRRVALKVLPAGVASDPERRGRLLREARAASSISHPNIATVFDAGEADGSVYIAMEYVEGQTLRRLLEAGPLAPAEAVRIGCEIARALAKAHAAGIVHRDLKPDNIMIGADEAVKILDFGLAKPIGSRGPKIESATVLSTIEGRILGTPSYMSPEQAKGKRVDGRSDLFSLGVVLYEMLSGRRPFTGDSTMEILIAVDRDEPPRLEGIPRQLADVVARCLEKDPAQRFGGAEELIVALESALGSRRPRWAPFALGIGGVALVALVATALAGSSAAVDTAATAPALGALPVVEPTRSFPVESPPAPSAAPPESSGAPATAVTPSPSTRAPLPSRPPRNPAVPKTSSKPKRDPLGEQK